MGDYLAVHLGFGGRIRLLMDINSRPLGDWPLYRADLRPAPFLPMSRAEMDALGWDACDVILVTGDAYIDHPSFGMALVGRLLESQGFRVGIISQPDWHSAADFRALGKPRLYFGITAGNMDSLVNRYTADRKPRSEDAYTAGGEVGKRPDRAVTVYAQRAREAFPDANIVIGSIEASLRRIAHYDYWSEKVRRSVLPDSKADLLIFGNAERAVLALTHRLAAGEAIASIRDLRGTAFMVKRDWLPGPDWQEVDSLGLDRPGRIEPHPNPYAEAGPEPTPRQTAHSRLRSYRCRRACRRARRSGRKRWSDCSPTRRSVPTKCCTRTTRGCSTWNRTRAMRGPCARRTGIGMCG